VSWENYKNVIDQLQAYGLVVSSLELGRIVRVSSEGDRGRQKTGWYSLHEIQTGSGDRLLVGAFGSWRDSAGAQKISLRGRKLSDDEKAAIKSRIAEDRRQAQARRKGEADRAARHAEHAWQKLDDDGDSEYLKRKHVGAYGVRFSARGNLVIPIGDVNGRIHGLQIIYSSDDMKRRKGRDKDFWPTGLAKRGHFHLIGAPTSILLVAEGYATAATLHAATGWPVAVAFDAGNLQPVVQALRKRYRKVNILICADDDFGTPDNPGVSSASAAALAVNGGWVAPQFPDDPVRESVRQALDDAPDDLPSPELRERIKAAVAGRPKLTDFNDLHVTSGSTAPVRAQLESRIAELGWDLAPDAPAASTTQGGGVGEDLQPIMSLEELHKRFALVYGHGSTVFDFQERILLSLSDMRDACIRRELHRDWMESPLKQIVRVKQVGFDPACADPDIKCNLWGGWPTEPVAGRCVRLLELLEYICSKETNCRDLYQWVLRWLAYPIQHQGAKMKTALVIHGPQGVGKNLFFEAVMAIYGEYGRVIDQAAVEDKFNDWASKKLFLIADEVVARTELYHTKNKVKNLVTGDTIRINPKNVTAYEEINHVNMVFMSNEIQPQALESDDRRFVVIWTPPKMSKMFYEEVKAEINDGGIAALHDYLLTFDLGDFKPYTWPPMTQAKQELIDLGLDSTERFIRAWLDGKLDPVPVVPCRSTDFYSVYRTYCTRAGIPKYAPRHILLGRAGKHKDLTKTQTHYMASGGRKQATFIFPNNNITPPDTMNKSLWLKDCIDEFTNGMQGWCDGYND